MHWIKRGVDMLVDPDREARLAQHVHALHHELGQQRESFMLDQAAAAIGISAADLSIVTQTIFKNILIKAWEDSQVTEQERRLLTWAAQKLRIPDQVQSQLQIEAGMDVYQRLLAQAMHDGRIDEAERRMLDQVATGMGVTVPELMQRYLREQSEAFLRGVFATVVEDGRLLQDEWARLLATTENLGLTGQQMLAAVAPQAQVFVEHVLADAKSDGVISDQETTTLDWLLTRFQLPDDFRRYARAEIRELKLFTEIAYGRLPTVAPPGLELRAGELAHFHGQATYLLTKQLRDGPRIERLDGDVVITDSRLIFTSPLKSHALNLRNVVQTDWNRSGVEVRGTAKGAGIYNFGAQHRLAYAILRCAVGRANQTITQTVEGGVGRHVPRDVRQRVWQRYGGRCAECRSDQYLEFDHIIPVAKGGSGTDNNIQLLCRGCNLKKSDHI